jgi:hypothetical protein
MYKNRNQHESRTEALLLWMTAKNEKRESKNDGDAKSKENLRTSFNKNANRKYYYQIPLVEKGGVLG